MDEAADEFEVASERANYIKRRAKSGAADPCPNLKANEHS